jgi:hypothetical protein
MSRSTWQFYCEAEWAGTVSGVARVCAGSFLRDRREFQKTPVILNFGWNAE